MKRKTIFKKKKKKEREGRRKEEKRKKEVHAWRQLGGEKLGESN